MNLIGCFTRTSPLSAMVGFAGVILSVVWYVMGAQDRFLSDFYRWQVKEAADRWKALLSVMMKANSDKSNVLEQAHAAATDHVGKVEDALVDRYRAWRDQQIKGPFWRTVECVSSWRRKHLSTTQPGSLSSISSLSPSHHGWQTQAGKFCFLKIGPELAHRLAPI
jgi:hypothetical protein